MDSENKYAVTAPMSRLLCENGRRTNVARFTICYPIKQTTPKSVEPDTRQFLRRRANPARPKPNPANANALGSGTAVSWKPLR